MQGGRRWLPPFFFVRSLYDPLWPSHRKRCDGHLPLLCAGAHEGEAGL